jgi:hypothetical protein
MTEYKLNPNEIYLRLFVKKHNSKTNYTFFEKYLDGYDYQKAYYMLPKMEQFQLSPPKTKEGWKTIFDNLDTYCGSVGSPVIKRKDEIKHTSVRFISDKIEKYNSGFDVEIDDIINQSELPQLIFDPEILNDPSLISILCMPRLEYIGGNGTTNQLSKFKKANPHFKPIGIDFLDWFIVIPPMSHPNRIKECPYSDEVVMNAPYYRTEVLPSGSILLQMTESTDFTRFDQEYWDKMIELYNYFITQPAITN